MELKDMRDFHKIGLFICWSIAADAAIVTLKAFPNSKKSLVLHAFVQTFVSILTPLFGLIYLLIKGIDITKHCSQSLLAYQCVHNATGLSMFLVPLGLLAFGWTLFVVRKLETFPALWLIKLRWCHITFGTMVWFVLKIEVTMGIMIAKYYTFLPVVLMSFFWASWFSFKKDRACCRNSLYAPEEKVTRTISRQQQQLIRRINQGDSLMETIAKELPKMRFVVAYNSIYDLTGFEHPGGAQILSLASGRDVTRFLTGTQDLEEILGIAHEHSMSAFQCLNKYRIGRVECKETLLRKIDGSLELKELDAERKERTALINDKFNSSQWFLCEVEEVQNYAGPVFQVVLRSSQASFCQHIHEDMVSRNFNVSFHFLARRNWVSRTGGC
jgi:cytochrome b involved in lipid metabolism